MELKTARCPNCSGELRLDPSKKSGFCMHCGSELLVEEAINRVRVDGIASMDSLFILAEEAREAGNLEEALKYYKRVLELDPYHYKAKFEKALIEFEAPYIVNLESIYDRIREGEKRLELALKSAPQNEREELTKRKAMKLRESALIMFDKSTKQFSIKGKKLTDPDTISIEYESYYKTLNKVIACLELSSFCNPELKVDNDKSIVSFIRMFLTAFNEFAIHPRNPFVGKPLGIFGKIIAEKEEEILRHDSSYVRIRDRNKECYIATAVYGDYNAPEVMVLRQYRDEVLSKTYIGRLFIQAYYALSPPFSKKVQCNQFIRNIMKYVLSGLVKRLNCPARNHSCK